MGLFNLVKKAAIYNAVEQAYKEQLPVYERKVLECVRLMEKMTEEEQTGFYKKGLSEYCTASLNAAIESVVRAEGQPDIFNLKLFRAMSNPGSFDMDDYDFTTSWAGATYALLCFVLCGEKAPLNKCIELNHVQRTLMNQVLAKYSEQLE